MFAVICFAVGRPVEAQTCFDNTDCNDGNPCTDDRCLSPGTASCWNISNCDDTLFCNGTAICCTNPAGCGGVGFGQCQPGIPIVCPPGQFCSETELGGCIECETNADCDDGNQCTQNVCDANLTCTHPDLVGSCNDGDLCSVNDTCGPDPDTGDWTCIGDPLDCNAPECRIGTCNPSNGLCQYSDVPDGTVCTINDLCFAGGECQSGSCTGVPADGCVDLYFQVSAAGPIRVGDIINVELHAASNGCGTTAGCSAGQAVLAIEATFSWDSTVFEIWDPSQTIIACTSDLDCPPEMFCDTFASLCEGLNPEDPCDDPDPCNTDCGSPALYNWATGTSIYPFDCGEGRDWINAPCTGKVPDNDGDGFYTAWQQNECGAQPACVGAAGIFVTNLKFKAISPTVGVSGPAAIGLESCIIQTRTKVASGSEPGVDVMGRLGTPLLLDVECVSGVDCPFGVCVDGECISCPAPTVEVLASRYVAVTPAEGTPPVAIRVEGVGPDVSGCVEYVGFGGLLANTTTPRSEPPGFGGWGTAIVRGANLLGGRTYDVYADCDPANPGMSLSEPVPAILWRSGDVNNNGVVDIIDATQILDAFRGVFYTIACASDADCVVVRPHKWCDPAVGRCLWVTIENADLIGDIGCLPNGVISIVDVTYDLDRFRGLPDPCVPSCP
jgi:hypothetical protein